MSEKQNMAQRHDVQESLEILNELRSRLANEVDEDARKWLMKQVSLAEKSYKRELRLKLWSCSGCRKTKESTTLPPGWSQSGETNHKQIASWCVSCSRKAAKDGTLE